MPVAGTCTRCGYISSQALCKACVLLEGLNRGMARISLGKETRAAKAFESAREASARPPAKEAESTEKRDSPVSVTPSPK